MTVRLPAAHWGTRAISCYEKVEQIGEGTYGQVKSSIVFEVRGDERCDERCDTQLISCHHFTAYCQFHIPPAQAAPTEYSRLRPIKPEYWTCSMAQISVRSIRQEIG